jgi:riboflavin kinase/FMN adenylyltransferase
MLIIRDLEDLRIRTPRVLTFGVFDGLHLGHQLIMNSVVTRSRALGMPATVVTFDPHPRAVLHPEGAPPLLQTFEQKMRSMGDLGVDQVVVLRFTNALSQMPAESFLTEIIFGRLDAREVYLGRGFAFGHNREGRFDLLKDVAVGRDRVAQEVPEVKLRGHRVSSTIIRRLLTAGRVNLARRMLGRAYEIQSRVVEGRKLGKAELGFATANLKPANQVLPRTGVYVTVTGYRERYYRSITNVGYRPTFGGDTEIGVETHLLGFDADLYAEEISVRFLHRLRGEMKFSSIDTLRGQIEIDSRKAVVYFEKADRCRPENRPSTPSGDV